MSGSPDGREQLNRINRESSRYNLGTASRTVSTPSFPLVYLHPQVQARVKFSKKGSQNVDGVICSMIEFQERSRPALVGTHWGADVLARGRFWIEANGRVRRAEVRVDLNATSRGVVHVSYRPEHGLGVLVPRELWEWYQGALAALPPSSAGSINSTGLGGTYLECLATYTNFSAIHRDDIGACEETPITFAPAANSCKNEPESSPETDEAPALPSPSKALIS